MLFKSKDTEIEEALLEFYANFICTCFAGPSRNEAKESAKDLLEAAKQKMKDSGQDNLPHYFGEIIIQKEKEDHKFMNMHIKRQDGVTDADILFFWNMHPLERCMLFVMDDWFRNASVLKGLDEGLSMDEIETKNRKNYPIYGDLLDTSYASGEDRPLPPELKDRINKWIEKHLINSRSLEDFSHPFTTMNAFIREEIKKGNI